MGALHGVLDHVVDLEVRSPRIEVLPSFIGGRLERPPRSWLELGLTSAMPLRDIPALLLGLVLEPRLLLDPQAAAAIAHPAARNGMSAV